MGKSAITVATFNIHAGMDGWGREFDYLKALSDVSADVTAIQEVFLNKAKYEQLCSFATSNNINFVVAPLANAIINNLDASPVELGGPKSWGPGGRPGRPGNIRSLYLVEEKGSETDTSAKKIVGFDELLPGEDIGERFDIPHKKGINLRDVGILSLVLLSKLPIKSYKLYRLAMLRSDRAKRCALVTVIGDGNKEIEVTATHLGHLTHGSVLQMRQLARVCGQNNLPSVILGDFNCWGPPLVTLLNHQKPVLPDLIAEAYPNESRLYQEVVNMTESDLPSGIKTEYKKAHWQRAVLKKSWPAWRPHSQVDHILVNHLVKEKKPIELTDYGSDHLPLAGQLSY